MQLSDFLYSKTTPEIIFPPDPIDPCYFLDLKEHLDTNQDYRNQRIEWRKTKPAIWDMRRIKEEFFQEFCDTDLKVFHRDIEFYITHDPELSVEELATKFCEECRGYEMTYGREFVERAIRRCNYGNTISNYR